MLIIGGFSRRQILPSRDASPISNPVRLDIRTGSYRKIDIWCWRLLELISRIIANPANENIMDDPFQAQEGVGRRCLASNGGR